MTRSAPSEEVSIRRAAAIAGLTEQTVSRWVRTKKLKARIERAGPLLVKLVKISDVLKLKSQITAGRKPRGGR
jgi:hypothetical protein